jgi:hypothetical protein
VRDSEHGCPTDGEPYLGNAQTVGANTAGVIHDWCRKRGDSALAEGRCSPGYPSQLGTISGIPKVSLFTIYWRSEALQISLRSRMPKPLDMACLGIRHVVMYRWAPL